MASGHGGGFAPLLIALSLVLAACGDGEGEPAATGATLAVASTATTSTTTEPSPPSSPPPTLAEGQLDAIDAEVTVPEGDGSFPAVVLVHGGGWIGGDPSVMSDLARFLTSEGFLTVNTRYRLAASESPGYPAALDDVACAVRYAAAHTDSDGTVAVLGWSAGAHLGAVVALTGDRFGAACPIPGSGLPERFIGLAGPYDATRMGIAVVPFFGGGPESFPEEWAAGNPQELADENPALDALLLHAENDGLIDLGFVTEFHRALTEAGATSFLEIVEGARHSDLHDPEVVGDLVITWLER